MAPLTPVTPGQGLAQGVHWSHWRKKKVCFKMWSLMCFKMLAQTGQVVVLTPVSWSRWTVGPVYSRVLKQVSCCILNTTPLPPCGHTLYRKDAGEIKPLLCWLKEGRTKPAEKYLTLLTVLTIELSLQRLWKQINMILRQHFLFTPWP